MKLELPIKSMVYGCLLLLILVACDSDTVEGPVPFDPGDPVHTMWVGIYQSGDQTDNGVLSLEITGFEKDLKGEIVLRSRVSERPYFPLFVRGTYNNGQLMLVLDKEKLAYQYDMTILANARSDSIFGSLSLSLLDLTAVIRCREIPLGVAAIETTVDVDFTVLAIAWKDPHLWLTKTGAYRRMTNTGQITDDVIVYWYPEIQWGSDALTSDGDSLWGHLASTRVHADMPPTNYSQIAKFTEAGIVSKYDLPHQSAGLATAQGELWSLSIGSDTIHQFSDMGTIIDVVSVDVPDLYKLDYDGTHFWSLGWFLAKLYKIDKQGVVVGAFDIPTDDGMLFQAGVALEGGGIWIGRNDAFHGVSRLYKLRPNP